MIKLILVVLVFVLALISGISVVLYQLLGWKGLIALPFIFLALTWVAKIVIGKVFKKVALGLFGMKAAALRGATMKVQAVTPVAKPVRETTATLEKDGNEGSDQPETDAKDFTADREQPKHYFAVDLTITPKADAANAFWEPGELILASEKISSLEDLDKKQVGSAHEVRIWKDDAFVRDEECKYPGEQRLRVVFEVDPGKSKAWLHYYNEPIGELSFPAWQPALASA